MSNKIIAVLLTVQLVLCMVLGSFPPAFAEGDTIAIDSKDAFVAFARTCTLDSASQGKAAELMCDIDFSGDEFIPVPTFGGTFNGNGYTLSGISISGRGSYKGVFRYVRSGAKISNLNVKGSITPNGSKDFVGGIVGENSGTLENCSFEGTVKGQNVVGGIAGSNASSGSIISCNAFGSIVGENSTGGIAGKNSGFIQSCTNNAAINTIYEEKESTLADIDADTGAIIENYKSVAEESEEESILGHSDTGGIAGYSSGIMQGCVNNASIGYPHIGYNVGGVVGRQSGYMLGCQNYGFIQGRKDVGGIVGQAEPYVILSTSESNLRNLRGELNTLSSMIDKLIADTDNLSTLSEKHLDELSSYSKIAGDSAELLVNEGTDFVNDNMDEINAQAAILSNTLDKLEPVFDNLENSGGELADGLEKISDTLDKLTIHTPDLENEVEAISSALYEISDSERSIKKAVSKARRAKYALDDAITFNNTANVKTAVSELSAAIKSIASSKQQIKASIDKLIEIIKEKPQSLEELGVNAQEALEALKNIGSGVLTSIKSLNTIGSSLDTIILNAKIDLSKFSDAAEYAEEAFDYLVDAMYYITGGISSLARALENFSDKLSDYGDEISEELNEAKDGLADGLDLLSFAADDIKTSLGDMKDIISDLADEKPLELIKLSDEFRGASEELFNSLSGIGDELDSLKSTLSSEGDKLTGDLSSINNQFRLIMNMMIDEFEELTSGEHSLEDIFIDVSDEDIEGTRQGKLADCHNFGAVEADRNTGGIVGAMAIEYSKDPEDDIEKPSTLNFTYRSKAVIQACINDGKTTGKKDCTGGIVGLAEIGTVYKCENYADTESTNGNYVGGIAGKSDAGIRRSYTKARAVGKRYVGGIVGRGSTVISSYAIARVNGDESTGAICGGGENRADLYGNFFTDNGLGAIDGISYKDKAEPISFEALSSIGGIPSRFISFGVTFVADGNTVGTQDIKYGDSTARIKYPDIPEKDGYFGVWQKPETETVTEDITLTCEYKPYITIISSAEKNESGKLAIALAEGEFTDEAELHAYVGNEKPPVAEGENVVVYSLSLKNTSLGENDTTAIRLLNENKDSVTAWRLADGKWEKINLSDKGKYVLIQMNGTSDTICLKYEARSLVFLWIAIITFIILFAVAVIKTKLRKRH